MDSRWGNGYTYTYDNSGNILSKKEYAYTTDTLGSELSTVNYTYGDSAWGDLLTEYGGRTITHDEIGNPLSDGTWNYTWEHGRELASMSNGSTTWSYTYNADGLRTQRTNGATTYNYIYNGGSLSQMTVGSNTLYFAYDASGTPMSVTYNGTNYYYATNLQGDVAAILDTSGTAVVQYTYDAWGSPLSVTGTMAETLGAVNPLRYRGYVYDTETTLYYLQSRYYDPEIGRFINADSYASTGQGILGNNMFAYCGNNPSNGLDPTGERADLWPLLFEDHDPGFIHRRVQEHIVIKALFTDEFVLPGTGRVDIYDPETGEIWEIKHGGSSLKMQEKRTSDAQKQINRYENNKSNIPLHAGRAGAFTGGFYINCVNKSYLVTYNTPEPGVILYYVEQAPNFEPEASYAYARKKRENTYMIGALIVPAFMGGGSSSRDAIIYDAYGLS